MTKEEFTVLNDLYDASLGRAARLKDVFSLRLKDPKKVLEKLKKKGFMDDCGNITAAGKTALEPYRVENAVILAAGAATRFIPLSLEQPKGLYEVKGERLIERQIQQLKEAGISNITIVLGYKKDMFAYLQDKYGVNLLFNPSFNSKNNIESLRVAGEYLNNSYICVCDSYYIENPFHQFEYCSFYAGYSSNRKEDEMYARIDETGRIVDMEKSLEEGLVLLGHSFWRKDFAQGFLRLAEQDREKGEYDKKFWEWLVKDNLSFLSPLYFKEYAPGTIYEFDYFEQLREFDVGYANHSHSDIIRNIKLVFRCDEEDIVDFRTVSKGLTNTSFIFQIDGVDYIYRHPGDGTDSIINRRNEKRSLIKAKEFGIDPTYIYMDVIEGWKISKFIRDFREPDYHDFEDSKKVISVLKRLHSLPYKPDYGMRPWEDSLVMEKLLKEKDPGCFSMHEELKNKIRKLYERTLGDGVEKCFCHGDTYQPNWMIRNDEEVILIDWEYSGYSDPGIDVGYYIVDALYDYSDAERFIREYLGNDCTKEKEFHYFAYTAIIAYYWFVWALYRESCGSDMGDALTNWHDMAEKYAEYLISPAAV